MPRTIAPLLLSLALGACASRQADVPLVASDGVAALVGEWEGEYTSAATGRRGSIVFHITAARDRTYGAHGDVVMAPPPGVVMNQPTTPGARADSMPGGGARSRVLAIHAVRIAGDSVTGALEPYRGPDCDCTLVTTFRGLVHGDVIDGTFTTTGGTGPAPQDGKWRVTRRK